MGRVHGRHFRAPLPVRELPFACKWEDARKRGAEANRRRGKGKGRPTVGVHADCERRLCEHRSRSYGPLCTLRGAKTKRGRIKREVDANGRSEGKLGCVSDWRTWRRKLSRRK